MNKTRRTRLVCDTCVEDRRPVPDVHRGHGLLRAQQFTDDSRGHHTGRVTDLQRQTGSVPESRHHSTMFLTLPTQNKHIKETQ